MRLKKTSWFYLTLHREGFKQMTNGETESGALFFEEICPVGFGKRPN
jgi:hypothetical protein